MLKRKQNNFKTPPRNILKKGGALSLLFFLSVSLFGYAQDWDKRHAFAKTYFGVNNYFSGNLSAGKYLDENSRVQSFEKHSFFTPAINIGATHFWGHADFYVSIATKDIKRSQDEVENSYRLGTFTGLRVYPLASKINTIRPYFGYKFSPFRYKQTNAQNQEFKFTQVKSVFDFGLGVQLSNFYITMEYGKVVRPDFQTFLSRSVQNQDKFPENLFQFGINYTLETTKKASTEENKTAHTLFSNSNKWGFFLALGPSSAFPIKTSPYISDSFPFLDNKTFPIIFPDLSVGYHFTKADIVAALAFRPINQKRKAYGYELDIKRRSVNLEAYKFLFDYHGFVPYLGMGLGYENIRLTEKEAGVNLPGLSTATLSPNLVFGWDIRPSVKGDWWILRTNLRYYPFLTVNPSAGKLSLQHLEFNFIQFVLYPQKRKKSKQGI